MEQPEVVMPQPALPQAAGIGPVEIHSPTEGVPAVQEPVRLQSSNDQANEEAFARTMAQLRQAQEAHGPSQHEVTPATTSDDAALQEQREKMLALADEQIAAEEQAKLLQAQVDVPPPQSQTTLVKENKSFIAIAIEQIKSQIKGVITAPARAVNWVRAQLSAIAGRVTAFLRPPQNNTPPQPA